MRLILSMTSQRNGNCQLIKQKCNQSSIKNCDVCWNENVITTEGNCQSNNSNNCVYQTNNAAEICVLCNNLLFGENCEKGVNNCLTSKNDICYNPSEGFYINNTQLIECPNSVICQYGNNEILNTNIFEIFKCNTNTILKTNEGCVTEINCVESSNIECITCVSNYHILNGKCIENSDGCSLQNKDLCLGCTDGIMWEGSCYSKHLINCGDFVQTCQKCPYGFYKDVYSCKSVEDNYPNCTYISIVNEICIECEPNYYQVEGKCIQIDQTVEFNTSFMFDVNTTLINESNTSVPTKLTNLENCIEPTEKGCLRCNDGFYLKNNKCLECDFQCETCYNFTYCTKCNKYSNTIEGKCIEINSLIDTCDVVMATYTGCVKCKSGYYKSSDGKQCAICDDTCLTCQNKKSSLTCVDGFYKYNENSLCRNQSELLNCINATKSGCIICATGYYLDENNCEKCDEKCTLCKSKSECFNCATNYILQDTTCLDLSLIEHCVSAENNRCTKCEVNYKLNLEERYCEKTKKLWNFNWCSAFGIICSHFYYYSYNRFFNIFNTPQNK
ncbi:hypothetical protein EIN_201980 [Entamoeba invadens IP1]|uniref:Uncharacterized protein n=1 Tax=Entamoeba invadens IP1 TaxID=370355 RepID=A0A0A1U5Q5_ENTIV|nr:hypothetical protein EIN_201980 [Entamoeba invadens IP1]ELP89643.1 hypothetical protein EIN_201980 [Entamoeba invadens IP1]|eukprot:XP_004256414.1 hypothetical protein EIN_201980 [Entamoeba invadens IP1]